MNTYKLSVSSRLGRGEVTFTAPSSAEAYKMANNLGYTVLGVISSTIFQ